MMNDKGNNLSSPDTSKVGMYVTTYYGNILGSASNVDILLSQEQAYLSLSNEEVVATRKKLGRH